MPRYYFDITDLKGVHRDEHGVECDDAEDARKQAQTLLADIIREQVPDGDHHEIVSQVRDAAGQIVYRAELRLKGTMNPTPAADPMVQDAPA